MADTPLIDCDDSVLLLIDVQAAFLDKLPASRRRAVLDNMRWLLAVARWLHVPCVVTAEDLPHLGGVASELAPLVADVPPHNKMIFNLADDPAILEAVNATNRKTAVLTGLETDVCVAQSALGLLAQGWRVVVVADATATPGLAHSAGLRRMRDAGVLLVNTRNLYYEWLRTVERVQRFRRECASLASPEGWRL